MPDTSVVFTVDTGATTTIMASMVCKQICDDERPDLDKSSRAKRINVADSMELRVLGKACLDFPSIRSPQFEWSECVCDRDWG